jgi:hypothetical protein
MNQICLKAALRKCNSQQFINQSNIRGRLCIFQTLESVAKSIPCGAEYETLGKIYLTSKYSYLLSCNLTHKTESENFN